MSASMADLPVTAPNCVGAIAPICIAAYSTRLAAKCSGIFLVLVRSDIGRHDLGNDRSRSSLGIITHIKCLYTVRKWLRSIEALYRVRSS